MKDNFSSTTYYKISVFIWDQKSISDINKCFLKNFISVHRKLFKKDKRNCCEKLCYIRWQQNKQHLKQHYAEIGDLAPPRVYECNTTVSNTNDVCNNLSICWC